MSVTNPCAATYSRRAAREDRTIARVRDNMKRTAFRAHYPVVYDVLPLLRKSYGRRGQVAVKHLVMTVDNTVVMVNRFFVRNA